MHFQKKNSTKYLIAKTKFVFVAFLMVFGFAQELIAKNQCSSLFLDEQVPSFLSQRKFSNTNQILKRLIDKGELKKIRKADKYSTHLEIFEDYILEGIHRLQRLRASAPGKQAREIDRIIEEAQEHLEKKKVTYVWMWNFTLKTVTVLDEIDTIKIQKNSETAIIDLSGIENLKRSIDGLLSRFPEHIGFPSFDYQNYEHFIKMEGTDLFVFALRENTEEIHYGQASPIMNMNHDFIHYRYLVDIEIPRFGLSNLKEKWFDLNAKIKNHIARLSGTKKIYVEFAYFWLIHERFESEKITLVKKYTNQSQGKMSDYVATIFGYKWLLENDVEFTKENKISNPNIAKLPEIWDSYLTPKNRRKALIQGIGGLMKILDDIESEKNKNPQE